jgi:hypothetical protein
MHAVAHVEITAVKQSLADCRFVFLIQAVIEDLALCRLETFQPESDETILAAVTIDLQSGIADLDGLTGYDINDDLGALTVTSSTRRLMLLT